MGSVFAWKENAVLGVLSWILSVMARMPQVFICFLLELRPCLTFLFLWLQISFESFLVWWTSITIFFLVLLDYNHFLICVRYFLSVERLLCPIFLLLVFMLHIPHCLIQLFSPTFFQVFLCIPYWVDQLPWVLLDILLLWKTCLQVRLHWFYNIHPFGLVLLFPLTPDCFFPFICKSSLISLIFICPWFF